MTSGVPTVTTKDHWHKDKDGKYRSSHPKYEGMMIESLGLNKWYLHCPNQGDPVKRDTLEAAKRYAYMEANWVAPSVRELI